MSRTGGGTVNPSGDQAPGLPGSGPALPAGTCTRWPRAASTERCARSLPHPTPQRGAACGEDQGAGHTPPTPGTHHPPRSTHHPPRGAGRVYETRDCKFRPVFRRPCQAPAGCSPAHHGGWPPLVPPKPTDIGFQAPVSTNGHVPTVLSLDIVHAVKVSLLASHFLTRTPVHA